jgi:hypothetical protein
MQDTAILGNVKIAALCLLSSNFFLLASPSAVSAQATAQIRGVVRAPQVFGIAGVTVNLLSVEKARKAKTDENGKFEFLDLPLSTYELEVSQAGFAPVPIQKLSLIEPVVRQVLIEVRPSTSECLPKIRASYEGRSDRTNLAGKLAEYSSSASPVKNATLTVTNVETTTTQIVSSNEKGEFQFDSLAPGKYTLKVSRKEYSDLAGIDFWVTGENLTRLPILYLFRKDEHSVILCQ